MSEDVGRKEIGQSAKDYIPKELSECLFPKDFMFGAGIGDYQHFGGACCDLPQIKTPNHSVLYRQDFNMIEQLNLSAFRTAIEWARIEPKKDKIDEAGIEFYKRYLSELKEKDVKTFVTLHHFTNPRWIHKDGSWLSKSVSDKFLEYVGMVSSEFKDYIDYYLITNEPVQYILGTYLFGKFPPYRKTLAAFKCLNKFADTAKRAYEIIHKNDVRAKVGVSNALSPLEVSVKPNISSRVANSAYKIMTQSRGLNILTSDLYDDASVKFGDSEGLIDRLYNVMSRSGALRNLSVRMYDRLNYGFIDKLKDHSDFIGVNYYCKFLVKPPIRAGAVVYSKGLRNACRILGKRYGKPIVITENGFPTIDDRAKTAYLIRHLKEVHKAMRLDKANVVGYLWWNFIHGHEWFHGYGPNFSLIDVCMDGNLKRRVTNTATVYREIINNGISKEMVEKYKGVKLKFKGWPNIKF